ncbi:ATP phosphoribosyltransferase regulatory subunit [Bhargavaea cecembensis]|uniref:ATP phosphoribosyltransferase regulatory subunit n=1 Tax=Bhargavaea cecembensis TaxID=394098 RepID=UPI00058ACABB|nr:ATP phosphoribosyltransferase regulatory subunit [Bhargavaea cecembensis]
MTSFIYNPALIRQKQLEVEFLSFFHGHGFDIIDLPVVETFDWAGMTDDDLRLMPQRETWIQDGSVHALRHDWTNSIVRYLTKYKIDAERAAYSGPVFHSGSETRQLGMEVFSDRTARQQEALELLIGFMDDRLGDRAQTAVISHYALLPIILGGDRLAEPAIRRALSQRSSSALQQLLGDHPLPELLGDRPEAQVHKLRSAFPEIGPILEELTGWEETLRQAGIEAVYPDITALPSQSYYDGVFIRLYGPGRTAPIASGGQYTARKKAFGMGIFY